MIPFLAIPVLYFAAQFLPFYHSGGTDLPSMWSLFWYPELNEETIDFLNLFYWQFRINEFVFALLTTQLTAVLIIIAALIKKNSGLVAGLLGCWGLFGLISFFITRGLTFSPVMVYGGIAGILMLLLFLAAVVTSGLFMAKIYLEYKALVELYKLEQAEKSI